MINNFYWHTKMKSSAVHILATKKAGIKLASIPALNQLM